ncbi:uncharacterized protein LOC133929589 [Phragmites australis]|uniref:uncharacterized protein LOC133929589 n=1 Tax=Phragmites australis TaxID=29695 RepID=UPI002D78C056|nr:uncharacterized protein LOC133929589 [Phragmites australis]
MLSPTMLVLLYLPQFSTVPGDFFFGLKALIALFTDVILASFRWLERASELRVDGNQLVGPIPFDKEMMWRLGKKLRAIGNDGLCYGTKQEVLEGVVALAGVADCYSVRRSKRHDGWEQVGTCGIGTLAGSLYLARMEKGIGSL